MKKPLIYTVLPATILTITLILSVFVAYVKDFSIPFLVASCLVLVLALWFRENFGKPSVAIARTLLGALFLFSGFVKGVDPLGTEYQIHDYFMAYGISWADPFSLPLGMLMIAAEFVVGAALILNIRVPLASWGAVLLMVFFTITTFFDAVYDLVADCGCFGKALLLTNWQTLYKNIVLDTLVVIIFFGRYRIRNTFSLKNEVIIIAAITTLFVGFQFYNLRHLPVIDFLDWKKGVKLNPPKTQEVTYLFKYKNKASNEVREFHMQNLPPDVSTNWEYVDMVIDDPNPRNLMIPFFDHHDEHAQDVANQVADFPDYFFVVAIYDAPRASLKKADKLFELQDFARQKGYPFVFLFDLNANDKTIARFKQKVQRDDLDILYSDDKSIKAIIRSNPGLILLKDGVVVGKWAWRDVPSVKKIEEITK